MLVVRWGRGRPSFGREISFRSFQFVPRRGCLSFPLRRDSLDRIEWWKAARRGRCRIRKCDEENKSDGVSQRRPMVRMVKSTRTSALRAANMKNEGTSTKPGTEAQDGAEVYRV